MTRYIFSEWLHHFDDYIKRKKNRPVLLLLVNVSSHVTASDTSLQCVKLHFLPPNTTSHLQPLDAGIIKAFKAYYRRSQLQRLIKMLEDDKKPDIDLKGAICYYWHGRQFQQQALLTAGDTLGLLHQLQVVAVKKFLREMQCKP